MQPLKRLLRALWICAGTTGFCWAQNLLPNPNFDLGRDQPAGWSQVGTNGRRFANAHQGASALMVQGNERDQTLWRSEPVTLKPGSLYRLSFFSRCDRINAGGAAIAGLNTINRDFQVTESWTRYGFVFSVPEADAKTPVRLGQWRVSGGVLFARAALSPVIATYRRVTPEVELGEAESIQDGSYRFRPTFNWIGANGHRPLDLNRANFNTDRWVFLDGAEVIYRLKLEGCPQLKATVKASLNYHAAGTLHVEASRDRTNWLSLAECDGERRGASVELPGELFPADAIYLRLSCRGANANLQVNSFEYESRLGKPLPNAEGATYFVEVAQSSPAVSVALREVREPDVEGQWSLECAVKNLRGVSLALRGSLALEGKPPPAAQVQTQTVEPNSLTPWKLSCPEGDPGEHELMIRFQDGAGSTLFLGKTPVSSGFLADRRPGYPLAGTPDLRVWWCEGGWKIGRERSLPTSAGNAVKPVAVSAARGEYEPIQVILNPAKSCQLLSARVDSFRGSQGATVAISAQVDTVDYVRVTRPTDTSSRTGWYPDPLPPLKAPVELSGNKNLPLWVTIHVAPEAPAGDFQGELSLATTLGEVSVPILVHVYAFKLPDQTHLRSAIGLSVGEINQYHRLRTPEDKLAVYEQYLLNLARHRLSPQSFFDYAPLDLQYVGEGTNRRVQIDFSRFDLAAEKWLGQHHFNSFRLPSYGMASGTFQRRIDGEMGGFKQGTPEYDALFRSYLGQLEDHLRERHWLDKAYVYWFDEPVPADFDFVKAGMIQLKTAAPKIRRLLTTTPDAKLVGHVDIWCGLAHQWTPAKLRERRASSEEVWWYFCTTPKAPYVTEFIDHPGTELRLWGWQSWQYNFSGFLIWNAVYWNSPTVFAAPKRQDPWLDPMSYMSGFGHVPGYLGQWGNGDGRFLYPPREGADNDPTPRLVGPINSIRWENLRDGVEDYEYFWLLRQEIDRAAGAGVNATLLGEARRLLTVPSEVSRDLTHFTTDPRPLLAHRDRIAHMIEQLQSVTPAP